MPWMQVVEEHSEVVTLTYSTTYAVVLEAKNLALASIDSVYGRSVWQSDLYKLLELDQGQRVEIRVKPKGSSPTLHVELLRDAGLEWESACDFLVWPDQVLPSGELFGPAQGQDCIVEKGKYVISVSNLTNRQTEFDFRLLIRDFDVRPETYKSTSTEIWVSTTTTTWYNTTYKRPLG